MSNKNEGKILVIVAPSGTGKSTLISRLKQDFPDIEESVSYTTRKKRPSENNGIHYFFISDEEFLKMRNQGEFLEWACVHSHYYGTSKSFVQKKLFENKTLLFDLDIQGTDAFKREFGDKAFVIFISPPSFEVLEKRLIERGTENPESLQIRLKNAKEEMKRKNNFDACIINDDLDLAYVRLKETVERILRD